MAVKQDKRLVQLGLDFFQQLIRSLVAHRLVPWDLLPNTHLLEKRSQALKNDDVIAIHSTAAALPAQVAPRGAGGPRMCPVSMQRVSRRCPSPMAWSRWCWRCGSTRDSYNLFLYERCGCPGARRLGGGRHKRSETAGLSGFVTLQPRRCKH